jgi:hypothetical protein
LEYQSTVFFPSFVLAKVNHVDNAKAEEYYDYAGQDGQTFAAILESNADSQKDQRSQEEHDNYVKKRKPTPKSRSPTQLSSSRERKISHERNWIEKNNTRDF